MFTAIFTVLAAIIGSFLAFVLTYYKEKKQQRNRLRVACRILLHEANRHYYWLKTCSIPDLRNLLHEQDDFKEWETLKYELGAFTLDEFDVVFEHFTKMKAIKTTLMICNEVNGYPEESIKEAVRFASEAHKLLYWYTYRDEPEKLRKYYPDADPDKSPSAGNEKKFFQSSSRFTSDS